MAAVRQLARLRLQTNLTVNGDRGVAEAAAQAKGEHLKILAVTVLTSVAQADLAESGITLTSRSCAEARAPALAAAATA
jgi:orotidine-5'-phosphate decarboxylase